MTCAWCHRRDHDHFDMDAWLCDPCYNTYYRSHPEYAVSAPALTDTVIAMIYQEAPGQLLPAQSLGGSREYFFLERAGTHKVGDVVMLPPHLGRHTANPTASYTVRITATRSVGQRVAMHDAEIVGRAGKTDW